MSFEPGPLLVGLLVSGIGYVLFSYGRKQGRFPHLAIGVAMLAFPMFTSTVTAMLLVAAALLAALWVGVRAGL